MLRPAVVAFAATLIATASLALPARADKVSDFIAKLDADHDGTLDQAEVTKAADAAFDKLDTDHDGTLTAKEVGKRLAKADFAAADKDHDGTLDKAEYEGIVASRFQAVNKDSDATLDAKELKTTAGRSLARLLQ
jgi:Ca2+-binding EF-hand superfamily protein